MNYIRHLLFTAILTLLVFACNTKKQKHKISDSSQYDLLNPVVIELPDGLAEISGIAYYPKDTSVFAIEDEDGLFYKISLTRKNDIKKWRFDKKHDYEDVVLHDSIFYVLISNGDIESLKFIAGDSLITNKYLFPDASKKLNEFESLYYDDSLQQLVIFCKSCENDGHKKVSAWGFNITTKVYTPEVHSIDVMPIAEKLGMEKLKLKPSATAINPVSNDIYILSSISHLLIVTDRAGKFKTLFELDPSIYKQAEGIAFTPAGDLIISNESHQSGQATILIVKNKKKG